MNNVIPLERSYLCYDCNNVVVLQERTLRNVKKNGFTGVYCTKCGKQIRQNEQTEKPMNQRRD